MSVMSESAFNPLQRGVALMSAITIAVSCVCVVLGCGDDRNYPKGFLEEAAKGDPAGATAKATAPGDASSAAAGSFTGSAPRVRVEIPSAAPSEPAVETVEAPPETIVEAVAADLNLAPPELPAVAAGEEPYQKLAKNSKFDEFRRKCARYVQLRTELLPYGRKLADGTATPAEREKHNRIEHAAELAFKPLNAYMWDSRWDEADRAAMGWILYGGMQTPQ